MSRRYRGAWLKHPIRLPPGTWPNDLFPQRVAAGILGCSDRTLRRLTQAGEGPPVTPGFRGQGIWYRLQDIILWRNRLVGEGPQDLEALWTTWVFPRQGTPRWPKPTPRPSWQKVGMRHRAARVRRRREWQWLEATVEARLKTIELRQKGYDIDLIDVKWPSLSE